MRLEQRKKLKKKDGEYPAAFAGEAEKKDGEDSAAAGEAERLMFDTGRQTDIEVEAPKHFAGHLVLLEQRLPARVVVYFPVPQSCQVTSDIPGLYAVVCIEPSECLVVVADPRIELGDYERGAYFLMEFDELGK